MELSKRMRSAWAVPLSLALAGCISVGPDYKTPESPVPEAWRNAPEASAESLSPAPAAWWTVFGDPALEDMSILYPITFEELHNCQGVGEGKARKYGKEFIELIKDYVEENDIIRPDDFVVKSAPTKASHKIYIIQSVDRKLSLEDIADAKGLEMDELLDEIEAIVSSGTKLDLNYYIRQMVDDDIVDEIFDYFKNEATSDSLAEARENLGADYDDFEIRLVRIKFLCEVAS